MRLVYLLLTTTLLLFSCSSSSKPKSGAEALIGKWIMLGSLEHPMEVTAFEVLSLDSVVMDTDTAKCTIDGKTISVNAGGDSTMVLEYTLQNDFLTFTLSKQFTLILFREGKKLPEIPNEIRSAVVGQWQKDNHQVVISSDGEFKMTSQEDATYRIIDEGLLQLERIEKSLYATVTFDEGPVGKNVYPEHKLNWIVPYSVQSDSLTLFYLGDEVTYSRVK